MTHCDDFPLTDAKNSALRERPKLHEGGPRRPIALNTMVALSDFTEETGATRIVPDSNKLPYPAKEDSESWYAKSVPALMPKGGLMFFEGQCFHGGGANTTTSERRYGVTVDFCTGYLRTQENFILSIGQERAATFSSALQELIGFSISDGGLGHVYNHNPSPLMEKTPMPFTELD
jgi:ectoine hydroxylase-related dioxygenase (phytanoyl-CoA dioxygenase family)